MANCSKCGAKVNYGDKFCIKCGQPVQISSYNPDNDKWICGKCGTENESNYIICKKCLSDRKKCQIKENEVKIEKDTNVKSKDEAKNPIVTSDVAKAKVNAKVNFAANNQDLKDIKEYLEYINKHCKSIDTWVSLFGALSIVGIIIVFLYSCNL